MIENLVKAILNNGGEIKPLILPSGMGGGTGQMNPSIIHEGDRFIVNLRNVGYVLVHAENAQEFPSRFGPLTYLHPEDDLTLRTTNFYLELDHDLEIVRVTKVDTSELDIPPVWEFIGLEDARLVRWDGELYQTGVRRDTKPDGEGRMELSKLDVLPRSVREVSRLRIEPPGAPTYCEKNWMPVVDLPFHFVKWTNPTEIVRVNIEDGTSDTVFMGTAIHTDYDMRGGSQVIPYKDGRICVIHEVALFTNELKQKDAYYYHRFVEWDKDWNIRRISDRFNFMDARIEFSCGLVVHSESFVCTFGYQDNAAYVVKIPVEFVEGLLHEVEISPEEKKLALQNALRYFPEKHHPILAPEFLEELNLDRYIENPRSAEVNYSIASEYLEIGQTAAAVSHFLRCAEFGDREKDAKLIYGSLLHISRIFGILKSRKFSELGWLYQAVAFMPQRPEAYWMLSRYYEEKREYEESFTFAELGCRLQQKGYSFIEGIGFAGEYVLPFQKAVAAWWIGRTALAREIIFSLPDKYNLNEDYRALVQMNMTNIGAGAGVDISLRYTRGKISGNPFPGFDTIDQSYAQVWQDMFVLAMTEGKRDGYYLEIGGADPVWNNNTYLLEKKFGWKGVTIEIEEEEVAKWKGTRDNLIVCRDASQVNYARFLEGLGAPKDIDYLQIDCEPPQTSYEILLNIPLDEYRFAVITFEHDYYADVTREIRDKSREYLEAMGYVLVVNDISATGRHSFEDWWVNPELISRDTISRMQWHGSFVNHAEKFMIDKLTIKTK